MRKVFIPFTIFLFLTACTTDVPEPPNILIILVDDMGYSDPGCYGGEIQTPNLDRLAADGLRFTQFYNTARCWPTRGALMTGYYAQQVGRDNAPGIKGGPGGIRPGWAKLLPEYLKHAGYRSYHSGKWHIDGDALENGFDNSFMVARQNDYFRPEELRLDDLVLPRFERGSVNYSTVLIAERAIDQLKRHSSENGDQPFFSYVAFTAPHFPLHALPEDIEKVGDRYQPGWDVLREQRWEKILELGIASGELSEVEKDLGPPYHFPEAFEILGEGEVNRPLSWESLTDEQKHFQERKMAIHAAMVERVDVEIGRILDQLRGMDAIENTLIFFLSDNGASSEIMVRGNGHDPEADPGSAETYLCLGPGWSTMCNTPYRKHKTWVHEGGTCTPLIVNWPRGIPARGELRHDPGHVIDLAPTIFELAGIAVSDSLEVPLPGKSLVPVFEGEIRWERTLWWYHEGNRAVRDGDWKLVAARDEPWELFNLANDRTESDDLAEEQPDRVDELEAEWESILAEFREVAPLKEKVHAE